MPRIFITSLQIFFLSPSFGYNFLKIFVKQWISTIYCILPQLEIARPALDKDIIIYCIWRSNSPLEKFQSSSTSIKITEGIFKQKR